MFPDWTIPVLGPLFYVAGAFVAFEAIRRARTPQGAVGWAVFLFAWPIVAVPLYLLLGYARVQSYAEARREADMGLPDGSDAAVPPGPEAEARLAAMRAVALHPVTRGNAMTLLPEGHAAFAAMIGAVEGAERYVLVQFYILRDDRIGGRLGDALVAAVARGVKVRVIYDGFGSFFLTRRYRRMLTEAGIETYVQRGPARPLGRVGLNFRNHRKIVVVDGHARLHRRDERGRRIPQRIPRHAGGGARASRRAAPGAVPAGLVLGVGPAAGRRSELGLPPAARRHDRTGRGREPHGSARQRRALFRGAGADGAKRLWITSPYFAPEQSVLAALKLAALRGVEVRILLPEVPDRWTPWIAAFAFFDEVRHAGCEIWRYQGRFMHQKVALVDDDIVSVGTFNLDIRSCLLNFETTVVMHDPRAAREVEAMLLADFAQSIRLDRALPEQRLWLRLAAPVARLLAPLL
jgi:cardiolipin synthase A/B